MTIVEFIKARLDEDEQVARAATRYWHGVSVESATKAEEDHVRRFGPARVLADIEASRRILDESADILTAVSGWQTVEASDELDAILADRVVRLLAQPYADHPDYDPAWRV